MDRCAQILLALGQIRLLPAHNTATFYVMTLQGLTGYALSVGTSIRADLRRYFITCNTDTMMIYDTIMETLLTKGLFSRPPTITPPDKIDFIKHNSFD